MDIDGPEFISELNNQIAAIRSTASTGNLGGVARCVGLPQVPIELMA